MNFPHPPDKPEAAWYKCSCGTSMPAVQVFVRNSYACGADMPAVQLFLRYKYSCGTRMPAVQICLRYNYSCGTSMPAVQVCLPFIAKFLILSSQRKKPRKIRSLQLIGKPQILKMKGFLV